MHLEALLHKAKSNMCYAYDKNTIHIWLQTKKDDCKKVSLIAGDPFFWGPKDDDPDTWEWKHSNSDESIMEKKYSTDLFDYYFYSYKPPYKRCKYAFLIDDGKNEYLYGTNETYKLEKDDPRKYNLFNYFNFPFINPSDVIDTPSWVRDTVWYQIFPDRFCKGEDKPNCLEWGSVPLKVKNSMVFGGDIKGIISKLDYIRDLGITGIYFNPIFKAESTHKYDTTDYYQIDPIFGTNEDFKNLVKECHKRNIKIMLDCVFNHCGWYHPYWQDVIKNGKNSIYYECFNQRCEPMINFELEDGLPKKEFWKSKTIPNYDTFAFTPFMPKWNTDNEKTKAHLLDVTRYWMENYDIDGWRLDVSNEVSHDFWREFKKLVRRLNKDALILGENWDDSNPWLQGDQMDAVMNYGLQYPMAQFFGVDKYTPHVNATEFSYLINKLLVKYPKNIACNMFNLIDCHDTARVLNICGENKELMKLPFIFMFAFTGSPNIYYGTEVGLSGGNDPENRRCMIWDIDKQDKELYNFFKKLIEIRNNHSALKEVDLKWDIIDNNGVISFIKENENEYIYVVINNSPNEHEINLDNNLIDLFTNVASSSINKIKPYGYYMFHKNK